MRLERLIADGYIAGDLIAAGDAANYGLASFRLTERGARAIGVWPSDDPYEALHRLLEARIAEESDEDRKSNLQNLRDGFLHLGADVGTGTTSGALVELVRAVAT